MVADPGRRAHDALDRASPLPHLRSEWRVRHQSIERLEELQRNDPRRQIAVFQHQLRCLVGWGRLGERDVDAAGQHRDHAERGKRPFQLAHRTGAAIKGEGLGGDHAGRRSRCQRAAAQGHGHRRRRDHSRRCGTPATAAEQRRHSSCATSLSASVPDPRLANPHSTPGADALGATLDRMTATAVLEQARALPERPGVYLMKDARGQVLYIGKARRFALARALLLRVRTQHGAPHQRARRSDRHPRPRRDRLRGRRAAAGGDARQAPPAQLQRPAQGRQALPLPQGRRAARLAASDHHPPRRAGRGALLRALRLGGLGAAHARCRQEALPLAFLHEDDHRHGPTPLPRLLHQALHRPLHGLLHARGIPRRDRPDAALPRGPQQRRAATRRAGDGRGLRGARVRARRTPARPGRGDPPRHRAPAHGDHHRPRCRRLRPRAQRRRGLRAGLLRARHRRRRHRLVHAGRRARGARRQRRPRSSAPSSRSSSSRRRTCRAACCSRTRPPTASNCARRCARSAAAPWRSPFRSAANCAPWSRPPRRTRTRRSRCTACAGSPTATRPSRRSRCSRTSSICRSARAASSVTTSRRSRAATRWPRWWCSRTAARATINTAASASAPSRARTTSPRCARC